MYFVLHVRLDKFRVRETIRKIVDTSSVPAGKRVYRVATIAKVRTHLGRVADQSDDPVFREITPGV